MEIPPTHADITQVVRSREGELVAIEDDVQGVVNAINRIDPHLRVRYSKAGEYFVVYHKPDHEEEGNGDLVTTATELDHRITKEVERIHHRCQQPGYSYADDLEAREREAQKKLDAEFTEQNAEMYEQLAHAMRKDRGLTNRVFVPDVIPGS